MRRSAVDAAQTRVALLRSALDSFGEVGWKAATFESVAERAGVTRGALHHHFRSKQTLLTEALDWGWSEYGPLLFDHNQASISAHDFLSDLFRKFIDLVRTDDHFRSLVSTTVLAAPQASASVEAKFDALDAWRNDIAVALESTARRSLAVDTIAGLVVVILQGLTLTAVTRPEDLPAPSELDYAASALSRGLLS